MTAPARARAFEALWRTPPTEWSAELLEGCYRALRGRSVSATPYLMIATPSYRAPVPSHSTSVAAIQADLAAHGIASTRVVMPGDSLVTRARHRIVHEFLMSTATHLLQVDDDIDVLDPTAVRKMMELGKHVVGCACPLRMNPPAVAANPRGEDRIAKRLVIEPDMTTRVEDVGGAFLLTTRECLIQMQVHHASLAYQPERPADTTQILWALFDTAIEAKPRIENGVVVGHRARYASEDFHFCTLAREAGYDVWCYLPPRFRHWEGNISYEGHILDVWRLRSELPGGGQ